MSKQSSSSWHAVPPRREALFSGRECVSRSSLAQRVGASKRSDFRWHPKRERDCCNNEGLLTTPNRLGAVGVQRCKNEPSSMTKMNGAKSPIAFGGERSSVSLFALLLHRSPAALARWAEDLRQRQAATTLPKLTRSNGVLVRRISKHTSKTHKRGIKPP